jgi:hypothetical protein
MFAEESPSCDSTHDMAILAGGLWPLAWCASVGSIRTWLAVSYPVGWYLCSILRILCVIRLETFCRLMGLKNRAWDGYGTIYDADQRQRKQMIVVIPSFVCFTLCVLFAPWGFSLYYAPSQKRSRL